MLKGPSGRKDARRKAYLGKLVDSDTSMGSTAAEFGVRDSRLSERRLVLRPNVDSEEDLVGREAVFICELVRMPGFFFVPAIVDEDTPACFGEGQVLHIQGILI